MQNIGIIGAFCQPGGTCYVFQCLGGQEILLGCGLLGGSVPRLTLCYQKQSPEVFYKKGVLKNFTKLTWKHLCQSFFLNKVGGLRVATLLKKRLWHNCSPANFAKFLRTPFLQNTSGWLLLNSLVLSFKTNGNM